MSWKSELRRAGYDTSVIQEAAKPLVLGNIEREDLKGAVIGNPMQCCGSRHICRVTGAEAAWVGANVAVVAYSKKKIVRYVHNGGIPSMQDKGFFPLGYPVKLRRASPTSQLAAARERNASLRTGSRKASTERRWPSVVGEFRRKSD